MLEIFNVSPKDQGDMIATCSIHLKPFCQKIHNVLVFQQGQKRWVSLPREKFITRDGETKYKDNIEWDSGEVANRFRDQVLRALDEYTEKHGGLVAEDVVREVPMPF